jgi:hypothetical protein
VKLRFNLLLFVILVSQSVTVSARLLIFSDDVFIGCLDCVQTISDSVCNYDGPYGRLNSPKSIWNGGGEFGSLDSPKSPWSGSTRGPTMMDENGTIFGWFQINPEGGYTQSKKLNDLYRSMQGDLGRIRDTFCKD